MEFYKKYSFFDIGSDESDDENAETAGQELANFLINLKQIGRLSAKDVCTIAYLAKLCGLQGPATAFAFRPNAPTRHYNRHLNVCMKIDEVLYDSYTSQVPGHDKYAL